MQLKNSQQNRVLQFKGGNLTVTTLELMSDDCGQIEQELRQQTQRSPAFFQQTPVVLACERLNVPSLALELVVDLCRRYGLQPIAVRCSQEAIRKSALALGLGWFPPQNERHLQEVSRKQRELMPEPSKVVRNTVRSGQQVYARGADLVIIGSVNEGAEVIADGNILVWGSLRGRAIAGARGNQQAQVICQQLRAELVSIAGVFQVFEGFRFPREKNQPIVIRLQDERLLIS